MTNERPEMKMEMRMEQENRRTEPSEIERVLGQFTPERVHETYIKSGKDSDQPYLVLRQLERAYEQLQANGMDVSNRLEETRIGIVRAVYDNLMVVLDPGNSGIRDGEAVIRYGDDFCPDLNVPYVKRAVGLIEEYIRKIVPDSPCLEADQFELGEEEEEKFRNGEL
jgi:hypothetical protein